MNYYTLRKLGIIVTSMLLVFFIVVIYLNFGGSALTQRQAELICTKIVYETLGTDFKITRTHYNSFYSLSESKIELYMKYNNGSAVASDCIFKRKHLSNEILIHQAFLVNRSGKLIYLEGIKVKMLDN